MEPLWQQDGAKPHQANSVMDYLDRQFGPNMLALKARQGHPWAPASPDMNPCDFWLWGDLKEKVYKPLPQSMEELRNRISFHFNNLASQTISAAVMSMRKRARLWSKMMAKPLRGLKRELEFNYYVILVKLVLFILFNLWFLCRKSRK